MASNYPVSQDGAAHFLSPADATSAKTLETTLSAILLENDTTIQVADTAGTGFPDTYGVLSIEDELVIYTYRTPTTFVGCSRGAFGTTKIGHARGVKVEANMVSAFITRLQESITAIQSTLGIEGDYNFAQAGDAVVVPLVLDDDATAPDSQLVVRSTNVSNLGAIGFLSYAADNEQILFDGTYQGGTGIIPYHSLVVSLQKASGKLRVAKYSGLTPGTPYAGSPTSFPFSIDLTNDYVGIRENSPWSYLTVIGDYSAVSLTHHTKAVVSFAASTSGTELAIFHNSNSPYPISLQTRHSAVDAQVYPIALNPLGGHVLVGTETDDTVHELQVSGQAIINHTNSYTSGLILHNSGQSVGDKTGIDFLHYSSFLQAYIRDEILAGWPTRLHFAVDKTGGHSPTVVLTLDEAGYVKAANSGFKFPDNTTQTTAGLTSLPSHTHDDRYYTESEVDSILGGYSVSGHNHDSAYAASGHNHSGVYSPSGHNHDSAYAASGHNHDGSYAAGNHNHAMDYSAINHNHDSAYAAAYHDHTGYADVDHTHNGYADAIHYHSEYASTAHGHSGDTGSSDGSMGYHTHSISL